jgi:GTP cyclohydrolase I
MNKVKLTAHDVTVLAKALANKIDHALAPMVPLKVYPIPRGGIPAAYALSGIPDFKMIIVDTPEEADIFVDDIIDSGATMQHYCDDYPNTLFCALVDKTDAECPVSESWVIFPWEGDAETGIEDNIRRLLQYCGENTTREGLKETPRRVAKAWAHWCKGYSQNPADVMKVFTDGAENCDEMIVVKDIPIYSHCEHHMAAIIGTATIAYIPDGKILGLSKLARVADIFARRLQVQERLTNQIADTLVKHLAPKGVAVMIKARHMCMESRGICQQGHHTITCALRGVMRENASTRAEFLELAHK